MKLMSGKSNYIQSVLLLLAAAVINERSLVWVFQRQDAFSDRTNTAIRVFEVLCALIAFALILSNFERGKNLIAALRKTAKWLVEPLFSLDWKWGYAPLAGISVLRHIIGWGSEFGSVWYHPAVALIILQDALCSMLIGSCVFSFACRLAYCRRAAVIVAGLIYGAAAAIDIGFMHYARVRVSFGLLSGTSGALSIYLNAATLAFTGVCLVAASVSAHWFSKKSAVNGAWITLGQRLALALVAYIARPGEIIYYSSTVLVPGAYRAEMDSQLNEAKRFEGNALVVLSLRELISDRGVLVDVLPEHTSQLLAAYRSRDTRNTTPLGRPFKRIILVTMESLTTTLTSSQNPALPGVLTPTIDAVSPRSDSYYSSSFPTAYGLASHLTSHPNGQAMVQVGHPHALPAFLSQRGFRTAFFQSASLHFQSGERRFKEFGYKYLFGQETAQQNPEYAKFISGWGLCDRKVYEEAIDWMSLNRNEPIFLHILTADTHSPSGRLDWHGLEYPDTPQWIGKMGIARMLLESFFRADYDLKLFLEGLRSRQLLDDDTVVIITGDHTCPLGPTYNVIPGVHKNVVNAMPFMMISSRKIAWDYSRQASQIDTAPTVAALAGFAPNAQWWGRSMLSQSEPRPILAWRGPDGYVVLPDGSITAMSPDVQHAGWMILR